MKVTVIGSTQYREKILEHARYLKAQGHEVRVPAFDDHPELDELGVCEYNLEAIKWADEIHMIWDQRSPGVIFDFGMTFALGKPFRIVYLEPKTFTGVMKKYEQKFRREERR